MVVLLLLQLLLMLSLWFCLVVVVVLVLLFWHCLSCCRSLFLLSRCVLTVIRIVVFVDGDLFVVIVTVSNGVVHVAVFVLQSCSSVPQYHQRLSGPR